MNKRRIIAVSIDYGNTLDEPMPVIACIYKDDTLIFYQDKKEVGVQKEFFSNLDDLARRIEAGDYEWQDFYIDKGQGIYRDSNGVVLVDGEPALGIGVLGGSSKDISHISLRMFYEFLKVINRDNEGIIRDIEEDYKSGALRNDIAVLVDWLEDGELSNFEKYIIMMSRIRGHLFVVDYISNLMKIKDDYAIKSVYRLFSRLFSLEMRGYIDLSL